MNDLMDNVSRLDARERRWHDWLLWLHSPQSTVSRPSKEDSHPAVATYDRIHRYSPPVVIFPVTSTMQVIFLDFVTIHSSQYSPKPSRISPPVPGKLKTAPMVIYSLTATPRQLRIRSNLVRRPIRLQRGIRGTHAR